MTEPVQHDTSEGYCFICQAFTGNPALPALDRPVRCERGIGAVLTGAGPLGPGYVLVVPEVHYGDIATAIRLHADFLGFVERSLVEYERLFGEFTVWEHGSASLGVRTSGCVEHAHLNVIPKVDLAPPPEAQAVAGWSQVARSVKSPYLLLGGSGQPLTIGTDSGISQHYRRQWACITGDADRWDYAMAGNADLQRATAARYGA